MVFVRKAQTRNRENIAQRLRRHGITPTHQRMEIAHVLFTRREHLSADQILKLGESAANLPDEWPKSAYVRQLRGNSSGISSRSRVAALGRV